MSLSWLTQLQVPAALRIEPFSTRNSAVSQILSGVCAGLVRQSAFAHLSQGVRRGVTATLAHTSNLNNPLWQARNKIIVQHRLALLKYWKHCL